MANLETDPKTLDEQVDQNILALQAEGLIEETADLDIVRKQIHEGLINEANEEALDE